MSKRTLKRMEISDLLFAIVLYSSIGALKQSESSAGGASQQERQGGKVSMSRGNESKLVPSKWTGPESSADLNDRALQHPLCSRNATAYVGQTVKMYCCLARLDRELSVSWIRQGSVVVLTHGMAVFTSDERVSAFEENGIWSLVIRKVGHNDAGIYECQTNTEVKSSVTVKLEIKETRAQIRGPSEYIHSGSTLKLSCRVYLGPQGPDEDYAHSAVIHWFLEQRLLDQETETWRSKAAEPRIITTTKVGDNDIRGWLEIHKVTPFDSGNYTCVPSYAIPAWIQILVLPDASQAEYDGVSEVKLDTSAGQGQLEEVCSLCLYALMSLLLLKLQ